MRRPLPVSAGCLIAAALLAAQATACARAAGPASSPPAMPDGETWTAHGPGPSWWSPRSPSVGAIALGAPAVSGAETGIEPPVADAPPPIVPAPEPTPGVVEPHTRRLDSKTIPDGEPCLQELVKRGISFRTAEERRGIDTPIVVEGSLGGVVYRGIGGVPLLCDCRLAVALSWIGPDLLAQGVTEAWYSGAYSYRMSRVGRLSLHAYGLAIDVHELTVQGRRYSLTRDYERGLDEPCSSPSPLNRIACALRTTGLFRELLTPDTDADHYDHFHLSIVPLGEDPVRKVVAPHPASRTARAQTQEAPAGAQTQQGTRDDRKQPVPAEPREGTPSKRDGAQASNALPPAAPPAKPDAPAGTKPAEAETATRATAGKPDAPDQAKPGKERPDGPAKPRGATQGPHEPEKPASPGSERPHSDRAASAPATRKPARAPAARKPTPPPKRGDQPKAEQPVPPKAGDAPAASKPGEAPGRDQGQPRHDDPPASAPEKARGEGNNEPSPAPAARDGSGHARSGSKQKSPPSEARRDEPGKATPPQATRRSQAPSRGRRGGTKPGASGGTQAPSDPGASGGTKAPSDPGAGATASPKK